MPTNPPALAPATCVMCHAALDVLRAQEARTCRKPGCVHGYAMLPEQAKCRQCGVPLPLARQGIGDCGGLACVQQATRQRLSAARAAHEAAWERGRALVADAEAARGSSADEAAHHGMAIVPRNHVRSTRMRRKRRRELEAHVRQKLVDMREQSAEQIARHRAQPAPLPPELGPLFGAACAACRGHCCRGAGTHAFINERTLQEYLARHPGATDDEVVAAYLSHVPPRSQLPGCVYQGPKGCTLPRDMRSAICNSHLCHGLERALAHHREVAPLNALHVLHREGQMVSYRRLVVLPSAD